MARNDYECDAGHRFEYMAGYGEGRPEACTVEGCDEPIEIIWDCEPGDYFGTMGIIDRL